VIVILLFIFINCAIIVSIMYGMQYVY